MNASLRVFVPLLLLAAMFLFRPLAAQAPKIPAAPASTAASAAEEDYAAELPRIPALSPKEALASFQTLPGFRIEQVAAEPLVNSPVAIDFDERGRMFVCEMIDYSEQDKEKLGKVRMLEDTDGDGRMDKATVFVDGLSWPTALAWANGGLFIGAAPDLYFCKDTDGDGRADEKKLLYTGFNRNNVQGLINSFQWGLDNRLHGAAGTNGGDVRKADDPKAAPLSVRGRDFAINLRTLELSPVSGGAQHGMSFDVWGRKFDCSNSDHIQLVMFEDRYIARNPYLAAPSARMSIAADGGQAEVYRISPVEPWRIIRTKLRVSKRVPGAIEGGGRAAGYFTGATGVTIYRGNAYPPELHGTAFIGDVGSNIVHRKKLEPAGVGLTAKRIDEGKEFVASKDIWFRPAQFANAPDGTLYICDVYREVIEHPASLPPMIKKHLDLTSGRDRGRIYRVVPEGFKQPKFARLDKMTTAELVATLEHPNGWHRQTASRLIYEQNDSAAVPLLVKLAKESKSPLGRVHALRALDGFNAITPEGILAALADENPRVRQHAVQLAERVAAKSPEVRKNLAALASDDDSLVRYRLAYTLGELPVAERLAPLATLARRDADDKWMRLAVLSSLNEGAAETLRDLAIDIKFRSSAGGRYLLESLATQIGARNKEAEVAAVFSALESLPASEAALAQTLVRGVASGLSKARGGARPADLFAAGTRAGKILTDLVDRARKQAADEKLPTAERVSAIGALGLGKFADSQSILAGLWDYRQPQEVQLAAMAVVSKFAEPAAGAMLVGAWQKFTPRLRTEAAEVLLSRPSGIMQLLDAIEAGKVPAADIDPARVKLLQSHANAKIKERAQSLFANVKLARRQEVVDAYRGALALTGKAENGRTVFRKICAACHKLEGVGHQLAPNLATIKNRGAEAILLNVLDPNREVNPQFVNYVVITTDGRSFTGMISAETATSVVLTRAENASDTVLRVDIDELASTGLSIMPEGMEKQIDQQTMADLIAYLLTAE